MWVIRRWGLNTGRKLKIHNNNNNVRFVNNNQVMVGFTSVRCVNGKDILIVYIRLERMER